MCAASHAHASCIVTWHGSPANEPLLLLPFVAVYVFPATSSNTLERPLDYKPPSLSLSPVLPCGLRALASPFSHSPLVLPLLADVCAASSIRNDPYIPTERFGKITRARPLRFIYYRDRPSSILAFRPLRRWVGSRIGQVDALKASLARRRERGEKNQCSSTGLNAIFPPSPRPRPPYGKRRFGRRKGTYS